jgi:pimeloyl-ACP methyl ester carboxylesterase
MRKMQVSSGKATLAVMEWGDSGPTILALHPGVGDSRIWANCAGHWVEAGYHVVAYDRRGFGNSTWEPERHDDLTDLLAVIEATSNGPLAAVVGNSLGGGLALGLAIANPELVDRLVLLGASPSGYDYSNWPLAAEESRLDDEIEAANLAGDLDLVNTLEVHYWLDGVNQPEGRVGGAARDLMADMNGRALAAAPVGDKTKRPPAWPQLGNVGCPTLVIAGEHDLPGIQQQSKSLAAAIPHANFMELADSAHCPSLDQPDRLSAAVLELLVASV